MSKKITLRQAIDEAIAGGNGFRVARGLGWNDQVFVNGGDIVSLSSEYTRLCHAEWAARVRIFGVSMEKAVRMGEAEVEDALERAAESGNAEAIALRSFEDDDAEERLVGRATRGEWPDIT